MSITLTVPPSSFVTQYSWPFFVNAPLLGLLPTNISSMTFPAQGSIIRTVLVPSDVIYTSLPSGVKLTPSGSMPTSSMTLMIFPVLNVYNCCCIIIFIRYYGYFYHQGLYQKFLDRLLFLD